MSLKVVCEADGKLKKMKLEIYGNDLRKDRNETKPFRNTTAIISLPLARSI